MLNPREGLNIYQGVRYTDNNYQFVHSFHKWQLPVYSFCSQTEVPDCSESLSLSFSFSLKARGLLVQYGQPLICSFTACTLLHSLRKMKNENVTASLYIKCDIDS